METENDRGLVQQMIRPGTAWSQRGALHMGCLRAAKVHGEVEPYGPLEWVRKGEVLAHWPVKGISRERPRIGSRLGVAVVLTGLLRSSGSRCCTNAKPYRSWHKAGGIRVEGTHPLKLDGHKSPPLLDS